jgi:hypothetical protein
VTPYQPLTVRARPGTLLINSLFLKYPESARCPFFFTPSPVVLLSLWACLVFYLSRFVVVRKMQGYSAQDVEKQVDPQSPGHPQHEMATRSAIPEC